jgi:hypothetical protein
MADITKKKGTDFKEENVRQRVRANLMTAGFPSAKVDEVLSNIEKMPESLVQAYYEMIVEEVKERLKEDPDYQSKKRADGKSQFEYLDRL